MTPAQFVDKLNVNAGNVFPQVNAYRDRIVR